MNPDNPEAEGDCTEETNKKERTNMRTKNKNSKVPKSAKTRLSDLTPKKDARGGKPHPTGPGPGLTPPIYNPPSASSTVKKLVTA
jgi:hypothetical protein